MSWKIIGVIVGILSAAGTLFGYVKHEAIKLERVSVEQESMQEDIAEFKSEVRDDIKVIRGDQRAILDHLLRKE